MERMERTTPNDGAHAHAHAWHEALLARCKTLAPVVTAVAHPCDAHSLAAAVEAADLGLIAPILVGPEIGRAHV